MASRICLRLNDATSRCLFAKIQHHRPNFQFCKTYTPVRGFRRRNVLEKNETPVYENSYRFWRTFGFTAAFSATCVVGATIWEYENTRKAILKSFFQNRTIRRSERMTLEERMLNELPGTDLITTLLLLNLVVYLAWKVPKFRKTMIKYFTSSPATRMVTLPLFLSSFSHQSLFHFLANMYVLTGTSYLALDSLGAEQFTAMYLIGGVFGAFVSHLYKVAIGNPIASLGASASIMAIIGYSCVRYPTSEYQIIFLPMFKFSAMEILSVVLAIDVCGAVMRWKVIDHVAHLGGLFIGILWAKWIRDNAWPKRTEIINVWNKFRKTARIL